MFFFCIGSAINHFRSRLSVNGKVHFVLHFSKELTGCLCILVIVKSSCIYVRDFLIKPALGKPYLTDLLKQFLIILFGQRRTAVFQPFVVHNPTLNCVVLRNFINPFAELHGAIGIDFESDGDNHLQVVMLYFAADLTCAFSLNYSEIPNSCFWLEFMVGKYFCNMLVDCRCLHIIKCCKHFLCKPNILVFITHFNALRIITCRSNVCQVFGG